MRIIAKLLQLAAPLKPGFCITIHNAPWPELVIRDTQKGGPHRLPAISVAHCSNRGGRSLRTPELLFEAEESKRGIVLTPYCFRDEQAEIEQHSVRRTGNKLSVDWRLQGEHMVFARQWNASLEHQGFVAAFHRAAFIEQLRQEVDSELSLATDVIPAELKQLFERAISKTVAKSVVSHPFHTIK
jgi:hypothetical protein